MQQAQARRGRSRGLWQWVVFDAPSSSPMHNNPGICVIANGAEHKTKISVSSWRSFASRTPLRVTAALTGMTLVSFGRFVSAAEHAGPFVHARLSHPRNAFSHPKNAFSQLAFAPPPMNGWQHAWTPRKIDIPGSSIPLAVGPARSLLHAGVAHQRSRWLHGTPRQQGKGEAEWDALTADT
eukprot:1910108-Rhodomonas_salina.1